MSRMKSIRETCVIRGQAFLLPLLFAALSGLLLAVILLVPFPAQAGGDLASTGHESLTAGDFSTGAGAVRSPDVISQTVLTVNISNEPPGYLIDRLYNQLGDTNFAVALEYLKDHSNGVITDEFYNQVMASPGAQEVTLTMLRYYMSPNILYSVEIGADGSVHTRLLSGNDFVGAPGWATSLSQDGQFTLTHAQAPAYYFHTGTTSYGDWISYYRCFVVAWHPGYTVYLPLVTR